MKQTMALLPAHAPYWNVAQENFGRTHLDVGFRRRVASFPACGCFTAYTERHRQTNKKYPTIQPGESSSLEIIRHHFREIGEQEEKCPGSLCTHW